MTGRSGRRVRLATVATGVAVIFLLLAPAQAQDVSINFGQGTGGGGLTERVIQMIALLTVLSLAPSILVMMTSFTRIVVVLSLLRTALGTATAPPNAVIVSLALFMDLAKEQPAADANAVPLRVLMPAFMISELRRAFEIGFLLFVPFLVIDMVVASILMSMGMMMLPPAMISLPFKLIFFVLVDGWSLIAGSLVQSFVT